MKKEFGLWGLMGFAVTSLGGTLLHFLYNLADGAAWAAPFSSVNESTWEHMKLLFVPTFVFALVQSFFFRERQDFWCVKVRGSLLGLILIPVLFYTYNGVIGRSPDFINIAIFFISAAATYVYETERFKEEPSVCKRPRLALGIFFAIALLFLIFTFRAPTLGIFQDPTA